MENPQAVLLLSCPDVKGIVAEVSHFIFTYGGNIIQSQQHNDPETDTFFMRISWDISNFTVPQDKIITAFEPIALKFKMDYKIEFNNRRIQTAVFVSKYDHCLYDLLLRNKEGELDTDIKLIVSNHEDLRPVADYFDIPYHCFKVTSANKADIEAQETALLKEHNIDLIILARYMQIVSDNFVDTFKNQIINIHHSFLPAFIGARPYHQAYARGVKIIGATSHYVTADLDEGPIISQDVAHISHQDSVDQLIQKGRNLEKLVLSRAVKLHLEHRVLTFRNKTIVFE